VKTKGLVPIFLLLVFLISSSCAMKKTQKNRALIPLQIGSVAYITAPGKKFSKSSAHEPYMGLDRAPNFKYDADQDTATVDRKLTHYYFGYNYGWGGFEVAKETTDEKSDYSRYQFQVRVLGESDQSTHIRIAFGNQTLDDALQGEVE